MSSLCPFGRSLESCSYYSDRCYVSGYSSCPTDCCTNSNEYCDYDTGRCRTTSVIGAGIIVAIVLGIIAFAVAVALVARRQRMRRFYAAQQSQVISTQSVAYPANQPMVYAQPVQQMYPQVQGQPQQQQVYTGQPQFAGSAGQPVIYGQAAPMYSPQPMFAQQHQQQQPVSTYAAQPQSQYYAGQQPYVAQPVPQ